MRGGPTRRELLVGIVVGAAALLSALAVFVWWDQEGSWNQRTAAGYEISDDDPTRLVVLGGCNPDVRARLLGEHERDVVVVLETRGEHKGDCLMGSVVTLTAPLGGRRVVDAVSGDALVPIND